MKRTRETLTAIADHVAGGVVQVDAALMEGVAEPTYWTWLRASRRGDPEFLIDYCGEQMFFHKAVELARKHLLITGRDRFENRAIFPTKKKIWFQGMPTFQLDPALVGCDDETLKMLDLPDRYLRDKNGCVIQNEEELAVPVAASIKLVEANFVQYTPRSEQLVTGRLDIPVRVVPNKPPPVEVTVVEQQAIAPPTDVEDGVISEIVTSSPAELVGGANEPPTLPAAPMSDLERDLRDRLRERANNPAAAVRPVPAPPSGEDKDDFSVARTGAGTPPPGGFNVTGGKLPYRRTS